MSNDNEKETAGQADPEKAKELAEVVQTWKRGGVLWSVEMGGLGPGYEQAIQILIFELLGDMLGHPLPTDSLENWGEGTVSRLGNEFGFSGAQVGAAKGIAFQFLKYGYKSMLDKAPQDRKIQVSKSFPSLPEVPHV